MKTILESLQARAARLDATVVLAEGEDPRVVAAADRLAREKWARPVLLGRESEIRQAARAAGLTLLGVRVVDLSAGPSRERVDQLRLHLGLASEEEARERLGSPLWLAALMVARGEAQAAVGGAVHTTSEVLRAGLKVIGLQEGVRTVSSFFLMELKEQPPRVLFFADCGVVPEPTAAQLGDIAVSTAGSFERLTGLPPVTAFLAYSTHGSARHPGLERIREGMAQARARAPGRVFDGELQVDAALVPSVAARKAPGSPVGGKANVLIFPDLHSGNIAYKLVERLAGARALGPIVQGLKRPFCDLSRGASAEDIVHVAVVTAVLSEDT